ncbi:hypothetical protein [Enorma massiliensis]|uniref:hypothetical protein n=1 Tax=Enorma massiliensis TaxID=1472761 RepID=UPI000821D922|nr:Uncharacterised protein [uncultured Collinsella sp.]
MSDIASVALGRKAEGTMFTSAEEYEAVMAEIDKNPASIRRAVDERTMVKDEVRTTDIDMGRVIGSVYRLGADGHLEKAPASALRLKIKMVSDKVGDIVIDDFYPTFAARDPRAFEPADETEQLMDCDVEWFQLAMDNDAAATVALSRVIPDCPVLTDPGNGDPAYLPWGKGRYECSRRGYHAVNLTREEALEANREIFPLMIRFAEFNGCILGLEGDEPEFDEWEAWREQATADE